MLRLKQEYQSLKNQYACEPGFEQTSVEVMWNDQISEAIEKLFENVSEETKKLIILNHI